MVIGLAGPKLAGKGTVSDFLVKEHGAVVYHMSGIISDIISRLHLPKTRANLIATITGLRSELGEDILAQVLKKDIETAGDKLAIIDGIRMPMEVDVFSTLSDFRLWYIDAPMDVRYSRSLSRGEKEGETEMTLEEFEQEEHAVTETGITALATTATAVIMNNGSFADVYARVTEELGRLHG